MPFQSCNSVAMTPSQSDDRFSETLREFNAVQEELSQLAEADFARRQDLRDRETELRGDLRKFSAENTDDMSIDQLKRLIASVERRLEEHYGNRLSHTSGAQTGYGGGLDPKVLHRMHRAMDEAGDLPAIKAELTRLKDKLANLERM